MCDQKRGVRSLKSEIERVERMKLGRETKDDEVTWGFCIHRLDDQWVTLKLVINGNKTCSVQEIINYSCKGNTVTSILPRPYPFVYNSHYNYRVFIGG